MSCRRSYETDLPGFLEEPGAAAFADFRDHYPRCAACAAEVRAWSELRAALRGAAGAAAHPDPERLARYEADPAALPQAERGALERHLGGCAPCRDELRALAAFAPAARAAARARWSPLRALLASLRGVAFHPALAWILVGILLVPVVQRALGPVRDAREPAARSELEALPSAVREPALVAADDRPGERAEGRRDREGAPTPTAPEREPSRPEPQRAPPAPGVARKSAAIREERPAAAGERSAPAAGPVGAPAEAPSAAAEAAFAAGPPTLELRPGEPAEVALARAAGGLRLRLPLPAAAAERGALEVRVAEAAGRRELRERRAGPAPDAHLELAVPPGWLAPGAYRVEIYAAGEPEPRAPLARFALRVGGG